MLNNFGEIESGLSVLLVHVQKSMVAKKLASSTTATVQQQMRSLNDLMKQNEQQKTREDLTIEERLEVKKIDDHIRQARTKLDDLMRIKTEETKSATKDAATKLLEDTDTTISRVNSKQFDFLEDIFPTLCV